MECEDSLVVIENALLRRLKEVHAVRGTSDPIRFFLCTRLRGSEGARGERNVADAVGVRCQHELCIQRECIIELAVLST